MTVTLTVDLLDVTCRDTEDLTGADELYLTGGIAADGVAPHIIMTPPVSINDGQTMSFGGESRLWSGDVPDNLQVAMFLTAFDEDAAKDWSKRQGWIDAATKSFATGVGTSAAGGLALVLASNPAGWAVMGGALVAGLIVGGFYFVLGSDKDDALGNMQVLIPAAGPALEVLTWTFSQSGWWSGWDYTLRYQVRRDLPKDMKDNKDGPDNKQSADNKNAKDSKDGKDGKESKDGKEQKEEDKFSSLEKLTSLEKNTDFARRQVFLPPAVVTSGGRARSFIPPEERPQVTAAATDDALTQLIGLAVPRPGKDAVLD